MMLNKQEKREMLEDTLNKARRRAFELADKKAKAFAKKHMYSITADKVIKFLADTQKATGPFPISKSLLIASDKFKL